MDIDLKRLQSMVCALVQKLISDLVYAADVVQFYKLQQQQ